MAGSVAETLVTAFWNCGTQQTEDLAELPGILLIFLPDHAEAQAGLFLFPSGPVDQLCRVVGGRVTILEKQEILQLFSLPNRDWHFEEGPFRFIKSIFGLLFVEAVFEPSYLLDLN